MVLLCNYLKLFIWANCDCNAYKKQANPFPKRQLHKRNLHFGKQKESILLDWCFLQSQSAFFIPTEILIPLQKRCAVLRIDELRLFWSKCPHAFSILRITAISQNKNFPPLLQVINQQIDRYIWSSSATGTGYREQPH